MNRTAYIPVTHDDDDYWTHDIQLFVGKFPYYQNDTRMVQGKIHLSDEKFRYREHEIIPLNMKPGETCRRTYVMMHPYVIEPEVFMTVGMYPKPKQYADQDEAIGEVLSTQVKGMRQHQIGNSQAWYYPEDKLIVVWECYFYNFMRDKPLPEDEHMKNLWHGFEQWLCKQFPEATRIATPFNDPIAKTIEEYQAFLRTLGYAPIAQAAFGKAIEK
jgi:hypothetical protein